MQGDHPLGQGSLQQPLGQQQQGQGKATNCEPQQGRGQRCRGKRCQRQRCQRRRGFAGRANHRIARSKEACLPECRRNQARELATVLAGSWAEGCKRVSGCWRRNSRARAVAAMG